MLNRRKYPIVNILFLVPYTPTPIRTRPYNLVRALARCGHAVTLATLWETPADRQALEDLRAQGITVLALPLSRAQKAGNLARALVSPEPLQAYYCWQPALWQAVEERLASVQQPPVDVVHVEHLRGARYALRAAYWLAGQGSQVPVVWDSVDCISLLFERAAGRSRSLFGRWITRLDLPRTRRFEGWLAWQFGRVLVTAPADQAALEDLAIQSPLGKGRSLNGLVEVLPNGVDLDYFRPVAGERETATLVLSGKMSYHANVTAALVLVEEILPLVWAQRPEVIVNIVGSQPPRELLRLQERYPGRVTVTGEVSDLRPYLQSATLAVAPIVYGVGIQNKVLEAMSTATPVVTNPQAISALQVCAGQDLVVAPLEPGLPQGGQAFAQAILDLLDDPARRAQIGQAGRRYVEQHHSWDVIAGSLARIYRDCIEATAGAQKT